MYTNKKVVTEIFIVVFKIMFEALANLIFTIIFKQ